MDEFAFLCYNKVFNYDWMRETHDRDNETI